MLILILKLLWTYHIPHSSINIFTAKNAQGNDLNKFFSLAIYSKQNILSLYIIVEKEPTIIAHKNNNRGLYSWSYNKELLIEFYIELIIICILECNCNVYSILHLLLQYYSCDFQLDLMMHNFQTK